MSRELEALQTPNLDILRDEIVEELNELYPRTNRDFIKISWYFFEPFKTFKVSDRFTDEITCKNDKFNSGNLHLPLPLAYKITTYFMLLKERENER